MNNKFGEKLEQSARYFPSNQELNVLQIGLNSYFSLPERSARRNKLTKDISKSIFNAH